jgi:uncharacterized iron-regulated membrane protein
MTFRKAVFWLHLIAGLVAGLIIVVMSLTGAALAFENEIVAWAERDTRRVTPPAADAPRLALEELQKKFREAQPEVRPGTVMVSADPAAAVVFSVGREGTYYVNPYTGEVRQPASTKARDFMRLMEDWHRWLALAGDHRATGRAVTGACNAAFLFLAVSGLWLWWPRKWRTKGLKRSLVFLPGATGKARDWNWHNVIGFWSLPVLVVLTASGMVMSYRWANDLVYKVAGETPPVPAAGPGTPAAAAVAISIPEASTRPLNPTALLAVAQKELPGWETITLRTGNTQRGPRGENPRAAASSAAGGEGRAAPQAASITVKMPGTWPRTATTTLTLTLDPSTGGVLKREGFGDFSAGRQARTWLRFLHTGQALGWGGQLFAGLASLGGGVLVYTGFALAWRRFFIGKEPAAAPPAS